MSDLPVVLGHPDARLPARAHADDAGLDLRSIENIEIPPGERRRVRTGLRVAIPPGHGGLVLPRSGLALRSGLTLLNSPGLIDPGYRGDVDVIAHNTDPHEPVRLSVGDRIAQLVLVRLAALEPSVVDELPASERNEGGFGSTGSE
ncbi:MAG: dUTP pyrophosphatase [Gaiellales bacterium]|jgi:dUTP pyrophosphatase|nr:dUTP pyrophosphatase [Gaiellales bacterium]MDX6579418.1 dUTP pyrophosphatase [Gaiellales bacterium]